MDFFTAAAAFQVANEAARIREIAEDYAYENQPLSDDEWEVIHEQEDREWAAAAKVGDSRWRILGSICIAMQNGDLNLSNPRQSFLQVILDSQKTRINLSTKTIKIFYDRHQLSSIRLASIKEIESITREIFPGESASGVVRYRCHRKEIYLAYYPRPTVGYGCPIEGNAVKYGVRFRDRLFRWLQKNIPSLFGSPETKHVLVSPPKRSFPTIPPSYPPKPAQTAGFEPTPSPATSTAVTAPTGKKRARITYVKADGSRSDREVTLYSRLVVNGVTHAVTIREEGQKVTKKFLVAGFERLQLSPNLDLENTTDIRAWIDSNLPLKHDQAGSKPDLEKQVSPSRAASSPLKTKDAPSIVAPSLKSLLPQGAKGFAVFDLETTGLKTSECRIVEVALVCVSPDGRIMEVWESLVNPGEKIAERATEVHQIRNQDVAGAPTFEEISSLFAAKIDGHVLVAHNLLGFDLPVLERHFRDHSNLRVDLGAGICTLKGFSGNPQNGFKKKLPDLCAFHGVPFDSALAHTAKGDALPLARSLIIGMSHLKASTESVCVQSTLSLDRPIQACTRAMVKSLPQIGWERFNLSLRSGQIFSTTGPATRKADTPIRRAQAYAESLGLRYIKVNTFSKKSPPDFLLSTSLELENTKMKQARERRIPVVLIEEINQLPDLERPVLAWITQK